jgi:TetR/AcrR family transcriptional repressor of nem operon
MSGTRSPGRPRAFETADVLDAAIELFWSQGYRGTTTRDLERAANLSQSSLYNAFGSKGQLLEAALDRYFNSRTAAALAPLESSDDGLDAIDAYLDELGAKLISSRRGCLLVNMMIEDAGQSPEITARTRRYRERLGAALENTLDRAVARGETGVVPADAAAGLLCAVHGLAVVARSGAATDELERLIAGLRAQVAGWRA